MKYVYPGTRDTFEGRDPEAFGYIPISEEVYDNLCAGKIKWDGGDLVEDPDYATRAAQEEAKKAESERKSNIAKLKKKLRDEYDYIGVKIAMGVATAEEYADKIAEAEAIREQIRSLENQA